MSFGECIKRRRLELGLTQREVGERLGVTDVMIRIYEADQRHPKMSTAKRFAEALDMDFSYLVGASPEKLSEYDKAVYDIGKMVMDIVEDACDRYGIPVERLLNRIINSFTDMFYRYEQVLYFFNYQKPYKIR